MLKNEVEKMAKSDKGKLMSSKNSLKHGLRSSKILLPYEDKEEFEELLDSIHEKFKPNDAIEKILVNRIVVCLWRLNRIPELEIGLIKDVTKEINEFDLLYSSRDDSQKTEQTMLASAYLSNDDSYNSQRLALIARYETTISNEVSKAFMVFNAYRTSQKDNKGTIPSNIN